MMNVRNTQDSQVTPDTKRSEGLFLINSQGFQNTLKIFADIPEKYVTNLNDKKMAYQNLKKIS